MEITLARKVTEVFTNKIIEENKTVFMTTYNPLVLDGLDLSNDDIRLFTTDRNKHGHVEIRRVQVSEKLLKMDQPLLSLQPAIDAIVIQMDGDVIRKEKEAHCLCKSTTCAGGTT